MKKSIHLKIIPLLMLMAIGLYGQQSSPSDLWLNAGTDDFATIQQNTEQYFADKDKGRGSGYKQWKRWEYLEPKQASKMGKIINITAKT